MRESLFQTDFALALQEYRDIFELSPSVPQERKDRLAEISEKLPEAILTEFKDYLSMIERISTKHEHITNIIALQNRYAYLSGHMKEVDVNHVVDDALQMVDESLRKYEIRVVKEFGKLARIKVEKSKLIQLLVNLIKNGQEATYVNPIEDRKITITTRMEIGLPAGVICCISDNGCGFTAEQKKQLFVFGYTTKKNGFGFGLHSCANYLDSCNGSIQAHSDGPGLGAQLTIRLPVSS